MSMKEWAEKLLDRYNSATNIKEIVFLSKK